MPTITRGTTSQFSIETASLGTRSVTSGGFDYPTCSWVIGKSGYGQATDGGTIVPEYRDPRGWSVSASLLSTRVQNGETIPTWSISVTSPLDAPLGDYVLSITVNYTFGDAGSPSSGQILLNLNGAVLPALSLVEYPTSGSGSGVVCPATLQFAVFGTPQWSAELGKWHYTFQANASGQIDDVTVSLGGQSAPGYAGVLYDVYLAPSEIRSVSASISGMGGSCDHTETLTVTANAAPVGGSGSGSPSGSGIPSGSGSGSGLPTPSGNPDPGGSGSGSGLPSPSGSGSGSGSGLASGTSGSGSGSGLGSGSGTDNSTVYWCESGVVKSGLTAPPGVTTYPSQQACINAGCVLCPPLFIRYRCNAQGVCETFPTDNPNAGFKDCASANCKPVTPTTTVTYLRYICDEAGQCQDELVFDPTIGFEDCEHANCSPRPDPCFYYDHPIANITPTGIPNLSFSLSRLLNQGWQIVVTHAINDVPQNNPGVQVTESTWNWSVPRVVGSHHFIAELSKLGCQDQTADLILTVTGDGIGGGGDPYWCVNGTCVKSATQPGGTNVKGPYALQSQCQAACSSTTGGGGGTPCPPCPPPADPLTGGCSPSIEIQAPAQNASLRNFALVRVRLSDPNEQTDPCHHNYNRACNHESDGPALQLFLGNYSIPIQWKHVAGTPLNGIWEAHLDTRDYSNGAHQLRISSRGVGCCRVPNTVPVSFANTLQGNIFYRDTHAQVPAGFVVPDAMLGVETRALAPNTSRRYWEQWGVRSGTTLDGAYKHDDWPKHQPVLPVLGAQWNAQGQRLERHNYSAHVTFRLPLNRQIRFRRKWTPQFFLSAFDLKAQSVAKIRQVAPGTHFIWTQDPPRAHLYDGEKLTLLGDFNQTTQSDGTAAVNTHAPDAVDAALWESGEGGRKIIVIGAQSEDHPKGEMFAFDPDSDDVTMNYSVRNHPLVPRFVEVVKNVPIALYTGDTLTHAYDLRFGAPKLKWTHPDRATFCTLDGDTLLVAFGNKLYSTDGLTTPTLVRQFTSPVTAATKTLVGLQNGEVWKKNTDTAPWVQVHIHTGAVTGLTKWSAGTALQGVPGLSEAQTDEARAVVAGEGDYLLGERPDGSWFDERQLLVPADLVGKSVQRVSALDHFSVTVTAPTTPTTDDATQLPSKDERLLIGTANSGLLFVYQRSLLSEKDGAIPVSHDTIPRLFPFPMLPTTP